MLVAWTLARALYQQILLVWSRTVVLVLALHHVEPTLHIHMNTTTKCSKMQKVLQTGEFKKKNAKRCKMLQQWLKLKSARGAKKKKSTCTCSPFLLHGCTLGFAMCALCTAPAQRPSAGAGTKVICQRPRSLPSTKRGVWAWEGPILHPKPGESDRINYHLSVEVGALVFHLPFCPFPIL